MSLNFFFKLNDLLHRARRQAVVDTLYLLRYEREREKEEREKEKKERKGS